MSFTYAQVRSLNDIESDVYNYVINNREKVLCKSIRELAKDTHVSTATVMRFCKKMGCEGFLEFKYKLKQFMNEELEEQDSRSCFKDYVDYIKSKEYSNSIKKAANLIRTADSFFILGLGPYGGFAKYTAQSFSNIGFYCYGIVDNYYPVREMPKEGHSVIVMFCERNLESTIFEEIKKYKSKNYTVILITNEKVSAMEHLCDAVIYASEGKVSMGKFNSFVPMVYATEQIFYELTQNM